MTATYPDRDRMRNVDLVQAVWSAPSVDEGLEAVRRIGQDFHPSVISEMTYQSRFIVDPAQRPYAQDMTEDVFYSTLPENLRHRADSGDPRCTTVQSFPDHYFERYWDSGSDRQAWAADVLLALGRRVEDRAALHSASDLPSTDNERLTRALHRRATGDVVVRAAEEALLNATHRGLDDPFSRLATQQWMQLLERATDSAWPRLPAERFAGQPSRLVAWLTDIGDVAARIGAGPCARTTQRLVEALSEVDLRPGPVSLDEQVVEGWCGRCAMHFSYDLVLVLDDERAGADFLPADVTFVPENFNVATCTFCGLRAPVEVPMLYYSASRNRVVYNVPTYGGQLAREQAAANCRELLSQQRAGYLAALDEEGAARFDAAPEVMALGYHEFVSAMHLGDVIYEDHAFTFRRHDDGGAVLIDLSKAFVRFLSPEEARQMTVRQVPGALERLASLDMEAMREGIAPAMAYYEQRMAADPLDAKSRLELANVRLAHALGTDPRLAEILASRRY